MILKLKLISVDSNGNALFWNIFNIDVSKKKHFLWLFVVVMVVKGWEIPYSGLIQPVAI